MKNSNHAWKWMHVNELCGIGLELILWGKAIDVLIHGRETNLRQLRNWMNLKSWTMDEFKSQKPWKRKNGWIHGIGQKIKSNKLDNLKKSVGWCVDLGQLENPTERVNNLYPQMLNNVRKRNNGRIGKFKNGWNCISWMHSEWTWGRWIMDESTRIGQRIILLELDDDKQRNWDNFGKLENG
jgi:hypothetical protein